jgi:hypothetical protein
MTWLLDERAQLIPVRAGHPGSPDTRPASLASTKLVPVTAEPPYGAGGTCAWLTADRGAESFTTWHRWARGFDESGLWPLLITTHWQRPFGLSGPSPVPEPTSVFLANWEGIRLVSKDGTPLPHPPWPGLAAPSGAPDGDMVLLPGFSDHRASADLLLVPATRPADAMAQLGWFGACNWSLTGADIAAVLRTWEDRFGAYLVSIGVAEFDLVVTRPPTTDEQCLLLADEHYAFCPDNFSPQIYAEPVSYTREEYAEQLRGARRWHFWWD